MKCEHYGKSDDCTITCPENTDRGCNITDGDFNHRTGYGGHLRGITREATRLREQQNDAALAEIKAYCAIDSNNGYARTFYCGMQLAKHQIDLILKRYGL